jgi:hypothetical protein
MRTESNEVLSVQAIRRLDYQIYNYCATCKIKYPKDILRCGDCKYRVRTTGWRRSKVADKKRI